MAAANKFNCLVEDLAEKAHNLQSDTFKVALTNTAPTASQTTWNTTDHPVPAAGNGYTSGGNTLTVSASSQTAGAYTMVVSDSTFQASGGSIGPFRYAVMYNSTNGAKAMLWWDYGSSITLADTETLLFDVGASLIALS
jgi:hypothetical protein